MTYNRKPSFKTRCKIKAKLNKKRAIPRQGFVTVGNNTKIRHGQSLGEKIWLDALGVPERSKVVYGFKGKIMVLDGYDPKTNTAYEYNGANFHGSHKTYPKNRDTIIPWLGKTPNQLYYGTIERYNFLQSIGMRVFFVWDYDYKAHRSNGRFYRGPGDNLY